MHKTYLSIGAHIGDAELTTGLVLATKSLEGDKIITLALTAGERGNPKHMTVDDYRLQKIKEADDFAKMLQGESVVLNHRDGELPDTLDVRLEVARIIRKYKPTLIFTHWKHSMHKDHQLTSKIVEDASFFAGMDMGEKLEGERHYAPVYFAENWEDSEAFTPYVYIAGSHEGYELWKRAMQTHWFIMNSPSFRYYDYYTHLAVVRGCYARKDYAQAFSVHEYQKKIIL